MPMRTGSRKRAGSTMSGRKKAISPEVMQSDRYLGLSLSAQALYPQLLMESDTAGVVVGVRRALLSTGIPEAEKALRELVENGYVTPVEVNDDTVYLIIHYFVHNNYQPRYVERSAFYGRLPDYIEVPSKGGEIYGARCTHGVRTVQARAEQIGEEQIGEEQIGAEQSEEDTPPRISCPVCGADAAVGGTTNGLVQFQCLSCDVVAYLDPETGEAFADPYRRN